MDSTTSSKVYLRLWVCMRDVQRDGIIPGFPVRSVPETSLLRLMSIRRFLSAVKGSPATGSETDASVSGVLVDCIAAGVYLTSTCSSIPMRRLPMLTNFAACMTRGKSVGLVQRHVVAPVPCSYSEP